MGILRAILQNAEHYFQVWSFNLHYFMKQMEKRNKERKVHNTISKSYLISPLCHVSCSKQRSQLKNSIPFLSHLSAFKLSTSYQRPSEEKKKTQNLVHRNSSTIGTIYTSNISQARNYINIPSENKQMNKQTPLTIAFQLPIKETQKLHIKARIFTKVMSPLRTKDLHKKYIQ